MSDNEIPEYELADIANSWAELYTKLMTGNDLPPRPFWLRLSDSGFKVTEENRDNLSLGMLLGLHIKNEGLR